MGSLLVYPVVLHLRHHLVNLVRDPAATLRRYPLHCLLFYHQWRQHENLLANHQRAHRYYHLLFPHRNHLWPPRPFLRLFQLLSRRHAQLVIPVCSQRRHLQKYRLAAHQVNLQRILLPVLVRYPLRDPLLPQRVNLQGNRACDRQEAHLFVQQQSHLEVRVSNRHQSPAQLPREAQVLSRQVTLRQNLLHYLLYVLVRALLHCRQLSRPGCLHAIPVNRRQPSLLLCRQPAQQLVPLTNHPFNLVACRRANHLANLQDIPLDSQLSNLPANLALFQVLIQLDIHLNNPRVNQLGNPAIFQQEYHQLFRLCNQVGNPHCPLPHNRH